PKRLGAPSLARLNRTGSKKSNLDFHADIDYAHGLRRPHWHLRLSLQTLERFLLSGEDAVGRNARVLRAEVRHRRTQQQLLLPGDGRGLPREWEADVRDSHHSLAQLVQRILRAA